MEKQDNLSEGRGPREDIFLYGLLAILFNGPLSLKLVGVIGPRVNVMSS